MESLLSREVWRRARAACEYCRLPQALTPLPFQIDHVIARQHRGETSLENLALSCLSCNKRKGPNIAGLDPATGELVRLFHPRRDTWPEHFIWSHTELIGRTPIGRATVHVLAINHPDNIAVREALFDELGTPF